VIGDGSIQTQTAKPAVGQIEVDFVTEAPFRSDTEAIADQEHPDHQLRIDRGPPDVAVERRQLPPQVLKVDEPIDRPQEMVGWDVPFKRELIEQRSLLDLPMPHHDLQSCQLDRLNHRYPCVATADFFNEIGQLETSGLIYRSLSLGVRLIARFTSPWHFSLIFHLMHMVMMPIQELFT
jgi:hypothetical protein